MLIIAPQQNCEVEDDPLVDEHDSPRVNIDAQLPQSSFGLAGQHFGKNVKVDATKFFVGGMGKGTYVKAHKDRLLLSDNVKEIIVDKKAMLDYGKKGTGYDANEVDYELSIPDTDQPEGYQNKGIEKITVNGALVAQQVDASRKNVLIETKGSEDAAAILYTDIRTQGQIDIQDWTIAIAPRLGMAAWGGETNAPGVKARGRSLIMGNVFSKTGDIDIDVEDLSEFTGAISGKKLSDIIYANASLDGAICIEEYGKAIKNIAEAQEDKKCVWGPLYAESASVKFAAKNSGIVQINGAPLAATVTEAEAIAWLDLNAHAMQTIPFGVYAKQDIDIKTKDAATDYDKTTICIGQSMWTERNGSLAGNTQFSVTTPGAVVDKTFNVDNNFTILGVSRVWKTVNVGKDANINLDANDGDCQAVYKLNFLKNAEGNTLNLTQGYIGFVNNGTVSETEDTSFDVELQHPTTANFTAIGDVSAPDKLIPFGVSIWNGEQMPTTLKQYYINRDDKNGDLWTATQLAAQITGVTAPAKENTSFGKERNAILRSNINLADKPWAGINTTGLYRFTGFDTQKTITGINIVGDGKLSKAGTEGTGTNVTEIKAIAAGLFNTASVLEVNNLKIEAQTSIADTAEDINGVGALAGNVLYDLTVNNLDVVLRGGSFGATATTNVKTKNVAGVAGHVQRDVKFAGVTVDGNAATISGWSGLGGMIGCAEGKVNITDAAATSTYGAKTTSVTNELKMRVTYNSSTDPLYLADTEQGKVGLYIGTLPNIATEDHRQAKENAVVINVGGNTRNDYYNYATDGKQREAAAFVEGTFYDTQAGKTVNGIYFFTHKRQFDDGVRNSQYLIGQSGFNTNPKAVIINTQNFYIKKDGVASYDNTSALYYLQFKGIGGNN